MSSIKPKYKHLEFIDVNDDGILEEIAVVRRWDDGSLSYIDVKALAKIDKSRLKAVLSSPHADKYELWELLSQNQLSNGINALDFFHKNFIKILKAKGSKSTALGGGLNTVKAAGIGDMLGSEFSDPRGAVGKNEELGSNSGGSNVIP